MTTSEIEQLLEKYYEGNTTLQEEEALSDFFLGGDVPEHLAMHKPVFACFDEALKLEMQDTDFEQKLGFILQNIKAGNEVVSPDNRRSRIFYFSGIAASILLITGLLFTFKQDVFNLNGKHQGSMSTEIAYTNASEALLLVSGNLNHGLQHVERLQMVDKAIKNMELFNKFYQYQTIIINPDEVSKTSKK